MPSFERTERDRGLHRVNSITSATLIGGLALSGGFSVVAAHVYSGSKKPAPTVQVDDTATTATDPAPLPSEPVVTADTATDHPGEDQPGEDHPEGDDEGRTNNAPRNRPAPISSTIAAAGPSPTTTARPRTVVTAPKRTRQTKPPVSGGS